MWLSWAQVPVVLCTLFVVQSHGSQDDPDYGKTSCQLIESRRFICEEHFVQTDDGYILGTHRIVNPVLRKKKVPLKGPYIVQHGLLGSSGHLLSNSAGGFADDWTNGTDEVNLSTEGRNLGFMMANYGYDVWMANSRGNIYSRNHSHLNPKKDKKFWEFSFDQFIAHDTPSLIDHVLKTTGAETVGWIGHSQGSLIMFGLLAERPEYAEKVKPVIAMAPVAHVEHITSPIRYMLEIPGLTTLLYTLGGELNIPTSVLDLVATKFCDHTALREACGSFIFLIAGADFEQFNFTRVPVYYYHGLGGTSAWDLVHFGQNIENKGFRKFDYGLLGNILKYGSLTPPTYDLTAIQSNDIFLFYANKDVFADAKDLEKLRQSLRVPFTEYRIPDPNFTHLDFIWGLNVYDQVYHKIIEVMERFDRV